MKKIKQPKNIVISSDKKSKTETIDLPKPKRTILHFLTIIFMSIILCAWGTGTYFLGLALLSDTNSNLIILLAFFMFWLLFGAYVSYIIYLNLRVPLAQKITLSPEQLMVDSGASPLRHPENFSDLWAQIRHSTQRLHVIPKSKLLSIRLFRIGKRTEIIVQTSKTNIPIGQVFSGEEREWLYHHLRDYYDI